MAVVGSAEVVVRAITSAVKKDIQAAFAGTEKDAGASGQKAAKAYSDGFSNNLTVSNAISDSLNNSSSGSDAGDAGRDHGDRFNDAFANAVGGPGGLAETMKDAVQDALSGAGGAFGGGGGAGLTRGAGDAGDSAGRSFASRFNSIIHSNFANEAVRAANTFTSAFAIGNIIGPSIATLVSGLASAVSGLFAMASAASQAVGALAVLPGLLGVVAQAGGAIGLAFQGVSGALTAGFKQQAAPALKQAATNSYAVADAQKALSRAYQDAARAAADAQERVRDAQQGVADAAREVGRAQRDAAEASAAAERKVKDAIGEVVDAQNDLLKTQREVNAARREAIEDLQQLGFSAEEAALAEERAGLRLQDAAAALKAVQNLPADNRTRINAELAFKEAELNYRQAKDRNADLAKEQEAAAKAGVEGSKKVVDAKNKVNDAQESLADRERDLADARNDQAKTERDNQESIAAARRQLADAEESLGDAREAAARSAADSAQRIADAQEALRRAQEASNQATAGGTAAANAYATALNGLSKEAQDFVKYLVSLQDEFSALRAAAGQELFPKLTTAIQTLVSGLLPTLMSALRITGGLVGDLAIGFANAATRGDTFKNLLESQNETLALFADGGRDGRNSMDDLTTVVLNLLTAIQPITQRFARWTVALLDSWAAASSTSEGLGQLTGFFNRAGDRAALVGDIIKNFAKVIADLGRAADESGEGLLNSLNEWLIAKDKAFSTPEGQDDLKAYFEGVTDNLRSVAKAAGQIASVFLAMGDNKGAKEFFDNIGPAIENIGKIGDNMAGAGKPLADFFTALTDILVVLTDTDGIRLFFDTLNLALKPLAAFAKSDIGSSILIVGGAFFAVSQALLFMFGVARKTVQILTGRLFQGLQRIFRQSGKTAAGIGGIGGASDKAVSALKRQMTVDNQKIRTLQRLEAQALRTGGALGTMQKGALPPAGAAKAAAAPAASAGAGGARVAGNSAAEMAAIGKTGGAAAANADKAAKSTSRFGKLAKGATAPLKGLTKGLGALSLGLLGISGPVLLVIAGIAALIFFFKKLYDKSPEFRKFVDGIVAKLKELGQWVGEIFTKYVFPALNAFFGWVNKNLPIIGAWFGRVFTAIGGFITQHLVPAFQIAWRVTVRVFNAITAIITGAFEVIKFAITKILIPYVRMIWNIWQTLWRILKAIFTAWLNGWKLLISGIKAVINKVLIPVINVVRAAFQTLWVRVRDVANFIKGKWDWVAAKFRGFRDSIGRVITDIRSKFQSVWNKVNSAFSWTGIFDRAKERLAAAYGWIKSKTGDIVDRFEKIGSAIGAAFRGIPAKIKDGLNSMIGWLNSKLVANLNKFTGTFGIKVPSIPKLARGGVVPGVGTGMQDNVAAMLSPGEYVIRERVAKKIGYSRLDQMNRGATDGVGGIDLWPGDFSDQVSSLKKGASKVTKAVDKVATMSVSGLKNVGKYINENGLGAAINKVISGFSASIKSANFGGKNSFADKLATGLINTLVKQSKHIGSIFGDIGKGKASIAEAGAGFGVSVKGPWTYPLTRRYPVTQWPNSGHSPPNSIDIGSPSGVGVVAAAAGQVVTALDIGNRSYGRYIVIQHSKGISTLYAHLSKMLVKVGQRVKAGQGIGISGAYGNVTGPHLHFEVRGSGNSADFLRAHGVKLAKGGIARATPGGILSVIAEAGKNERVEPLGRDGLSVRDRAMINQVRAAVQDSQTAGNDTIIVNPAPGMDEAELALAVSRRIAWKRTTGT